MSVFLVSLSLFPCSLPSSVPSFFLLWDLCGRSMSLHRISDQRGLIRGWVPSSLWGGRSIHQFPGGLGEKSNFWVWNRSSPGAGLLLFVAGRNIHMPPVRSLTFKGLNFIGTAIKMEHKWTILRCCSWGWEDRFNWQNWNGFFLRKCTLG